MRPLVLPALVLPLAALAACETIRDAVKSRPSQDPNRNALVTVQDGAGNELDVPVVVGSDDLEVRGVKALQIKDWGEASRAFGDVLAKDPRNYAAAFGLAVAMEASGRFEDAAKQYKAANYIESKQANLDGIRRCEEKAAR
jgi:tetratricopeptide (TPR) repeat protein